ncbi:Oidioi.mRNA.OKI2018_I69.PAR.g10842.t1.cds [Oikopleura dioica]|uniref:Oidioi.mRNA.OKI2018_I69.PAR.g10842.t1.cds n=1 Tax=Oikopleura dioica TaxID=34765 RepID=A0ABN7RWQ8_OIKDI|nr:Oidioi.mRNA.OKI2018_I69.PAR.g10842.t1.cds [Oikopleura dioica]
MIRPRSLESDILLLSLPRQNSAQSNSPLTQMIINPPSTRPSESLPSPIFGNHQQVDPTDPQRTIRRTNTTATCGAAQLPPSKGRLLLDSDASTSPERSKTTHSVSDIHGFGDTRLALVRRSMIARRTQQRLREKRRRNRTVALSPEDDRRSSFISTFLDQKSLEDRSTQIPSQPSTLSKEAEEATKQPEKLGDLNSTLTATSPTQIKEPLNMNSLVLQAENNESSSGYWTGGSTIQTLPDRCVQELNDHNLMKHNSRFNNHSSISDHRTFSPLLQSAKSEFSTTDSEPLLFARPKPPPPSRSDSIPNSHSDSQPQSPSPEPLLIERPSTLVGLSDSYLSAVNSCEMSVLTPSDASESGISSNLEQFAFPSPPKNIPKSPTKNPLPPSSCNPMQDELAARLFHRRSKIERIENGEEEAFEKPARTFSSPEPEKVSLSPVSSPRKVSPKKILFGAPSSPAKSDSTLEEDSIEITVIENPNRALSDTSETEPLPKPEDDEVFERTSSPASLSPIRSSSVSPGRRPAGLGLGLRATQSLSSRGRSDSRRAKNLLTKNNTANFKSLLLQNISGGSKKDRISAAERLKVQPGQTLQDLYKPKSDSASSPNRSKSESLTTDQSPKRRNKSKNRFNSAHRLTSIVEEKDLQAAKEFYQNNYCNTNGDNCNDSTATAKTENCTTTNDNCTSSEQPAADQKNQTAV